MDHALKCWLSILALAATTTLNAQELPQAGVAVNHSTKTSCAEEDNVNIALFAATRQFRVTATSPKYEIGEGNCQADFTNCASALAKGPARKPDQCSKLFDDGTNVVEVCVVDGWWRDRDMEVTTPSGSSRGHYARLYRKTPEGNSYPQTFVMYQDGNVRLKPLPPKDRLDVCFGTSIIVGPAPVSERPFVEVDKVRIVPEDSAVRMSVGYVEGGESEMSLTVNREAAILTVETGSSSAQLPFATVRSMWVADDNCDLEKISAAGGTYPIIQWRKEQGPWWLFHRESRSKHNTSAPDLRVEVVQ